MGFGKRLEALIKYRNTNVNRLSKATGIGTQTLYMMIKRDSHSTDMTTMGLLANALDVNVSYFYDSRYIIDENGIHAAIDVNRGTHFARIYEISGRLTIKNELMNLLYFMSNDITQNTRGKLFPTDALIVYLIAYFQQLFEINPYAFCEQHFVTIDHSFVEYPTFYLAELHIKFSRHYQEAVFDFLSRHQISDDELIEYLFKSILQDYVNTHLKDHILYHSPCIKELVDWKAPFLDRKED